MSVIFQHTPEEPVRFHEYANLFPMLQGEALEALKQDIRDYGVREPIVFLDGAILDGRNRYMCARDLGIEYPRVEFEGTDPLSHVISHNLHRRHLTESQRSMVAAKLAKMERGDNQHHYEQYQEVSERTHLPVWLMFYHPRSKPDERDLKAGCPHKCPAGLFGNDIAKLKNCENHRHANWGKSGMVYWAADSLKKLKGAVQ